MNEHHGITGARVLNQTEIDLMNKIKAQGAQLLALVEEVQSHIKTANVAAHETQQPFAPGRWAAMGSTDLQTGLMFLTRAVARPSSF